MSSQELTTPPTPSPAASASASAASPVATVDENELLAQNRRLQEENALLRQRLEEERAVRRSLEGGGDHKALAARQHKEDIRQLDAGAEILSQHDELLRLRQTCAVLMEGMEETRSYFYELKRLYMELQNHLRPESSQARADGGS